MNAENQRRDVVWQNAESAQWFLESVRGGLPFAAAQFDVMLHMVAAANLPIRRFLDIGSGDGILSAVMLNSYPASEAVLVDFSPPMLEAASARLAAASTPPVLISADLLAEDWIARVAPLAPFDAIVSGFAIHHLPDARKQALYAEIHELLAPGGVFAHIEHVAPEAPWIRAAFDEGVVAGLVRHAREHDASSSAAEVAAAYAQRPDQHANILAPLDLQCAWLREAGFIEVTAPFRWYELAVFGGYRPR